jgi:hypothetical protein
MIGWEEVYQTRGLIRFMKTHLARANWQIRLQRLVMLSVVLVMAGAGCATHDERSYNEDFGQSLPAAPKYAIENIDDDRFKLVLHQGTPDAGPGRVSDMKSAAPIIAQAEARRRGWVNWQLDYIQERDQGWMHVLIAIITRKNPIEEVPDRSTSNQHGL